MVDVVLFYASKMHFGMETLKGKPFAGILSDISGPIRPTDSICPAWRFDVGDNENPLAIHPG